VHAVVGLAAVVIGAVLVTRPFSSLGVLVVLVGVAAGASGVMELIDAGPGRRPRWLEVTAGLGWLVVGAIALLWPDITIRTLAVLVGVWMVVSGALRFLAAMRSPTLDERLAAALLGIASMITGALALAWPDVTLLVVAIVFGVRTVIFGVQQLVRAVTGSTSGDEEAKQQDGRPSGLLRSARLVGAVVAVIGALMLASISAAVHRASPTIDEFYAAPNDVPAQPGQLLRSEPFDRGVPAGAEGWRILYTTTRSDGTPTVASAIVVRSESAPPGPRPVIAWAHGTTGFDEKCAPSLLDDPFRAGAMPALDQVVDNGWVLVATDYIGLGTEGPHPYLIGPGEAHSVLDAVRATRQLTQVDLADEVVVWGHSQGGHAALWTGVAAPDYAPDVDLVGVAAMAPASDLQGLVGNLEEVTGGSLFASYVIQAYADTYPDVSLRRYVAPPMQSFIDAFGTRCLSGPEVLLSAVESLAMRGPIFADDPTTGPFGERLAENTPTGRITVPLLVAQGLADELVLPSAQQQFVDRRCADGQPLEYRTYESRDHVGVVDNDSPLIPDLLSWTEDRLDRRPARSTC
jgi:uncharacterized membrane protein HdeD (DUF308 family)/pimeloyl-ACP methyl ester carboxylesterase